MFESIQTIATADGNAYVPGMICEAMKVGRMAATHMSWGEHFDAVKAQIEKAFANGRDWVEFDWKFLNGRAYGVMCFHSNGQMYGAYHFI